MSYLKSPIVHQVNIGRDYSMPPNAAQTTTPAQIPEGLFDMICYTGANPWKFVPDLVVASALRFGG